ncbi:uncharacterized protein LOC120257033 [Dioscorea cayenensis subsp. rotundata]|uniref:Uncharacterized protein LOC120257033 n=1 Tax=Dioscorea cayennensis subsp. rotundata TaxID=55577 RepID=A0AB40AZV6_DIOCR|nr:uncharacterized protein LOC120257033 [Dioscorea cayenensis subsp. rotundata]
MSIFKLHRWVVKSIDKIRRDFLWSSPESQQRKIRLVNWNRLCRSRDQGGWNIHNIETFNMALLGKWWWKILSGNRWCGDAIFIKKLFQRDAHRIFFISTGRKLFPQRTRSRNRYPPWINVVSSVGDGATTLFWLDNWVEGRAPADIWPHLYRSASNKEGTVRELVEELGGTPLGDSPIIRRVFDNLRSSLPLADDRRLWRLTSNGTFTIKSFYSFLNDRGLRCCWTPIILKSCCPKKVNLFNWLAWDDKILTLEKLALRRCNPFPTPTCVMCHADVESSQHLFTHCPVAVHIWRFFGQLFEVRGSPNSLKDLWGNWLPDSKRAKLDEPLKTVKRSLEFLTSRDMECVPSVPPSPLVLLSF